MMSGLMAFNIAGTVVVQIAPNKPYSVFHVMTAWQPLHQVANLFRNWNVQSPHVAAF